MGDVIPYKFVAQALSYDPISGDIRWKHRPDARSTVNSRCAGKIAGTITSSGYRQIGLLYEGKKFFRSGQRLAWLLHYGEWPNLLIDHIDHDTLNNRISNLRLSTHAENSQHRREARGKVGFKGVYWMPSKGKFAAQIKAANKWHWLGLHATAEAAARAYDCAARDMHGPFAETNADMGLLS